MTDYKSKKTIEGYMSSVSQYANTFSPEVEARIQRDVELANECIETAKKTEFPTHEARIKADEKCYAAMVKAMEDWPKNTDFPLLNRRMEVMCAKIHREIEHERAFAIPSLDIRDHDKCIEEVRSKSTPDERRARAQACSAAFLAKVERWRFPIDNPLNPMLAKEFASFQKIMSFEAMMRIKHPEDFSDLSMMRIENPENFSDPS